jgi:PKD repeat protein
MTENKLSINKVSRPGFLSVFPKAKDTPFNLHYVTNNAESKLRQTLSASGKYIILDDASKFPESGIIKINAASAESLLEINEVIFYGRKVGNQLHLLHRGYKNSSAKTWPAGSKVTGPLMAEHHNVLKDAIVQIQNKIGKKDNPTSDSINGILNHLETKWLSPKPSFKAYPRMGPASLTVTFHNFSIGDGGRFLWDFGDGATSSEQNPTHVYTNEGKFTVRLTMITANGSHGLAEKSEYIEVNNDKLPSFFYATPLQGSIATEFTLVDQSDGEIVERHWFFGDGEDLTVNNPNIHVVSHKYNKPGTYSPSLLIRLSDNKIRKVSLPEGIEVL